MDADTWAPAIDALADQVEPERVELVTWDRRGHWRSTDGAGPGSRREDAADLAGLLEHLGGGPAHLVGNSYGAIFTLTVVTERPDLVASAIVHEPPVFDLLHDASDPAIAVELAGDHHAAAERFVGVALGPDAWDELPEAFRDVLVANAPTYLDEHHDPTGMTIDADALAATSVPVLMTCGTDSPPLFPAVVDELASCAPSARTEVLTGVGHIPHATHPAEWASSVLAFHRRLAGDP